MDNLDISISSIFVIAAVAGFAELVRRLFKQDYEAVVIIAGAAGIGLAAGFLGIDNLSPATGLVMGLAASGFITWGQKMGQGTS